MTSFHSLRLEPEFSPSPRPVVLTVGHSTHPVENFLALLKRHEIAIVADVRSYPGSRRWPQFNQDELKSALERAGIGYRWIKQLGGRRHGARSDSPHIAWTSPGFRSYADYTESSQFEDGLRELTETALRARTACMCAEGLWWRCHRRIISDHLTVRGWSVIHILPDGRLAGHSLPDFARVVEGRVIYARSPENRC